MGNKQVVEASKAIALGVKLARVQIYPMYPITPATHIAEEIAKMINDNEADMEMIHVESEHSAASAVFGAQATGVRTFTATSAQGLALMFEILPILSGCRLPTVMAVANRALSAPLNIWNDHSDSVSVRDQGWIQLWVESSQEAIDSTIQAYKIAEDKDVQLPVMVNLDGFALSHVYEPVDIPEQKEVDEFLPAYKAQDHAFLDPEKPMTIGPVGFPSIYMEFKKEQNDAMLKSLAVVKKVHDKFAKKFGRAYGNGVIEEYLMKDAEYAFIGMGSLCGTARVACDKLRKEGQKVGLIKLRLLRPFPVEDLKKACKNLKALIVIDRHISVGFEGPLLTDLKSALFGMNVKLTGYIAGLGGRDITIGRLEKAFNETLSGKNSGWLM